jgi:hypothetical protein
MRTDPGIVAMANDYDKVIKLFAHICLSVHRVFSLLGWSISYDGIQRNWRNITKKSVESFWFDSTQRVDWYPALNQIPASVAITAHGDYRDAWVRYTWITQ